jgi:hypothetical protein
MIFKLGRVNTEEVQDCITTQTNGILGSVSESAQASLATKKDS